MSCASLLHANNLSICLPLVNLGFLFEQALAVVWEVDRQGSRGRRRETVTYVPNIQRIDLSR